MVAAFVTDTTNPPAPRHRWLRRGRFDLIEIADLITALICFGTGASWLNTQSNRHYHSLAPGEIALTALIVAVPLVLVLLIVGFSALPPYTPNGRAQSGPIATTSSGPGATAKASAGASTANPPAAATTVSSYEAEDATHNTLGPTTKLRALANASGGKVVTSLGHGTPAGDVKFNGVTADAAGRYTLTVYYTNAAATALRLALWVNGRGPTILSFPSSGGGDQIATVKATITLVAGTNTVRFSNATKNPTPDLDRITVAAQQ
jgi:hypothetical protein